jgi:hypothetical protein
MATYKPLQTIVLTSNASSIDFSNIDQTYTDLIVIPTFTPTSEGMDVYLTFNGDSTSGLYSKTHLAGYGTSSVGSTRFSGQNRIASYWQVGPGNLRPSRIHYSIMSYANNTNHKIVLAKASSFQTGAQEVNTFSGLWRNTAPITSLTLTASSGSFAAGSKFDMYGIKAGTAKAQGGDITITDGTYWYHAFKNSGTFTVQQGSALSVDYLVVAGGGAGGYNIGGGGGAGGYKSSTGFSCAGGSANTVIVGAGGSVGLNRGGSGSNSIFASVTSTGGGGGGGRSVGFGAGADGGSGGGGGGDNNGAGGSASPSGQGNAGGRGLNTTSPGGGGGGAGASGTNTTGESAPGNGGNGLNTLSSWASATGTGSSGYYAGGGGGGYNAGDNGGAGGGGYGGGASSVNNGRAAQAGTANTGGGGGGSSNGTAASIYGGQGGSGIVIVRYAV